MAQSKETKRLVRFIAEEATRYNLSQADLAERSGIGQATISRLFTGQNDPTLSSLEALANGLGYSLESLLLHAMQSFSGFDNAELMRIFMSLPARDRKIILDLARALRDNSVAPQ